jgi:hypothetical protein
MNDKDFLNIGVGRSNKTVTVINIDQEEVNLPSGPSSKAIFTVRDAEGREFKISDLLLEDRGESKKAGLWININDDGELSSYTGLAKLIKFYEVNSLQELIGKEVNADNDDNGFLVLSILKN